jgi:hypothetical protein
MKILLRLVVACVLPWAAGAPSFAGVRVVDPAGGAGVYTSVDLAIQAANPGDTILVHAGTYNEGPQIFNKALTIVADPPGAAVTLKNLVVLSIPPGQTMLVRGIDFVSPSVLPAIYVLGGTNGTVYLEDCSAQGAPGGVLLPAFGNASGADALALFGTPARVVAVRCAFTGGVGADSVVIGSQTFPASDGGAAVSTTSSIALYDCVLTGGVGGTGANGGPGLALFDGPSPAPFDVLLSGCVATGGSGTVGGAGAISNPSVPTTLDELDSTFAGGGGSSQNGAPLALSVNTTHVQWNETARSLEFSSPAHTANPIAFDVRGVQGDFVLLLVGTNAMVAPVFGAVGFLTVGLPFNLAVPFGSLVAPSGQATGTIPAPALPSPTFAGLTFVVDPVFQNGSALPVFGAPSTVTLLP